MTYVLFINIMKERVIPDALTLTQEKMSARKKNSGWEEGDGKETVKYWRVGSVLKVLASCVSVIQPSKHTY